MYSTWDGNTPTIPYNSQIEKYLVLSHPDLADGLVLSHFDQSPYDRTIMGFAIADSRSLVGSIKVQGGTYKKILISGNFLVRPPQLDLFNQLLEVQKQSLSPIEMVDYFITPTGEILNVWLQVDQKYVSNVAAQSWWRLQFEAWER